MGLERLISAESELTPEVLLRVPPVELPSESPFVPPLYMLGLMRPLLPTCSEIHIYPVLIKLQKLRPILVTFSWQSILCNFLDNDFD